MLAGEYLLYFLIMVPFLNVLLSINSETREVKASSERSEKIVWHFTMDLFNLSYSVIKSVSQTMLKYYLSKIAISVSTCAKNQVSID